jgi:lipopolysaccharide heptosyltransferase I
MRPQGEIKISLEPSILAEGQPAAAPGSAGGVLFVKMSSLGDVIHHFPAVTDTARAHPGMAIDWVVEEAYAPLVALHPAVRRAIPLNLRRLTRNLSSSAAWGDFALTRNAIRAARYDTVVDTQGLIKSAAIARIARGVRWGMDRASAREPLAALAYGHAVAIARKQHAVARNRELTAIALGHSHASPAHYLVLRGDAARHKPRQQRMAGSPLGDVGPSAGRQGLCGSAALGERH